jgi:membrane protease YdiL (CAAX protease family)
MNISATDDRARAGLSDLPPPPLASKRHTSRFLLIVAGIAFVGFLQTRQLSQAHAVPSRIPLYISVAALQLVFVWFINKGIRARGYSLVTLVGRRWKSARCGLVDISLGLAVVLLLRALTLLLRLAFGPTLAKVSFLLPHTFVESAMWICLAAIAGISEELVFRGYLQRQLWSLMQSLPVAILAQAAVFSVSHLYQGWRPALVTGLYGLVFGLLAAWRRSIVPGAIAHTATDMFGGLFGH